MRPSLLDAFAPHVTVGRKRLPCAVLRELLVDGELPQVSRASADATLLLGAIQHALLVSLRSDWQGEFPARPHALQDVGRSPRPALITGWRFQIAPLPATASLLLMRTTSRFLAGMTPELVRQVVRWAPPVVSAISNESAPVPVVGNVVAAFLARQVDPEGKVWVRVLERAVPARFSLLDLVAGLVPTLTPIMSRYRDRIVQAAPTVAIAEQLTGLQRAMLFRIRQRA